MTMSSQNFDRPTHCQALRTSADANGNSRVLYLLYSKGGDVLGVVRRYYNVPEECQNLVMLPEITVSPETFNEFLAKWESKSV